MSQDPEIITSMLSCNGEPEMSPTIENAILTLPNSIKALFLSSVNPAAVNRKWFSSSYDFVRDLRSSSTYRLNYQLLKRVDVLVGYERGYGKRMIKKPIWRRLTQRMYARSLGESMLCRLRPYSNSKLGIAPSKELELPCYDQYFVLKPPATVSAELDVGLGSGDLIDASDAVVNIFDGGFIGATTQYEQSVDLSPPETMNSNFFDCGEVA